MESVQNTIEALLNEHDVARMTGMSVATVRRWRLLRQGPKCLKLSAIAGRSGAVRYRRADVETWLDSRPTGGDDAIEK